MTSRQLAASLFLVFCVSAVSARAQSSSGAIVGGTAGVAMVDSNTDFSLTAAAGYRFNRAFGLGVELTVTPSLPRNLPGYYPFVRIDNPGGSVTVFTTNVRLEIPTTPTRIVPYVVMGGGVANVKQSADIIIAGIPPIDVGIAGLFPPGLTPLIFPPLDIRSPFTVSTTDLALTVGGGVSVLATHGMSIDVDLRYLRLMGQEDRNIGRFGAGVSYRF
jgi:opacity protein-like surface antigen